MASTKSIYLICSPVSPPLAHHLDELCHCNAAIEHEYEVSKVILRYWGVDHVDRLAILPSDDAAGGVLRPAIVHAKDHFPKPHTLAFGFSL
jgi:hypothetical protein